MTVERPDLLVIGAGPAGLACAIAAARGGASVRVLEADDRIGGALHYSGGHLSAAGTARQRERGIDDDVDRHYADVARITGDTHRAVLTRQAIEAAPETLAWLEEHGFTPLPETPRIVYGHEPYLTPRTVHAEGLAVAVLDAIVDALAEVGDAVDIRVGTPAVDLLVESGRVVGARSADGEEHRAAATVLTTGGFGHDPDLFDELEGVPLVTSAAPTSTGAGLRLARAIGAGVQGRGKYLPTFGGLPPEHGDLRVDWVHRPHLVAPERPPWEIYVDRFGRRWIDEDEPSIDRKERVLMTVAEMTFWTVFDARALRESHPMIHNTPREELDSLAGVRRGITKADTLADLARAAGIDPAGLTDEVARYNRFVADGVDADFGRTHLPAPIAEPPFYAIENHPVTLITFAGVDVDDELRVLSTDGTVIDGLYAVGEVIGAAVFNGNAFCSGMVLTPALAMGRLLGERLAGAEKED